MEKKTYASTHLICPAPEGQKYNAAVKWKLPAVSADWLLKCAEELELVSETPYLIGETMGKIFNSYSSLETLFHPFPLICNVCISASQPRIQNMRPPLTTPRTMTPMRIATVQVFFFSFFRVAAGPGRGQFL